MKIFSFLIVLFIFFVTGSTAQVINDSGGHSLMLIQTKESDRLNEIVGSPYLTDEFLPGIVTIEGKEPLQVFLRYDVEDENFEIKTDLSRSEIYILPLSHKGRYTIGSLNYLYEKISFEGETIAGYFIEHFDGEQVRMLEKPTVTYTEARKARTGYEKDKPSQIQIEEEFYLVFEDGRVENIRLRNRDIRKIFNSKTAKEYLSDHDIDTAEDLIAFLEFYSTNNDL